MIKFGQYDQVIDFISYQNISDGFGGTTPTETLELSTYGWVKQLRGADSIEANEMVLPTVFQIGVQYRAAFTPNTSMMIKYRNEVYKIAGVMKKYERYSQEWVLTAVSNGY